MKKQKYNLHQEYSHSLLAKRTQQRMRLFVVWDDLLFDLGRTCTLHSNRIARSSKFGAHFVKNLRVVASILPQKGNAEQVVQTVKKSQGRFNITQLGQSQRKEKDDAQIKRILPKHAVGALFNGAFLLLSLVTSEDYAAPYIEAAINVENFSEHRTIATPGLTLLAYETRLTADTDDKAEFDAGTYSQDNFESGSDDMEAVNDTDDYLTINHYGDNAPDTSSVDWWDDDSDTATKHNWHYRKCFDVDNSSSSDDIDEYQVYLDIDTATPVTASKMQSDGSDLRFTNESGVELPFYIADDMNTVSTRIWVQIDDISASTTEKVCMYYGYAGGGTASNASDRDAVFTYSTPQDIYYVVADTAVGGAAEFVSYDDNNDVTVGTYTDTLAQYEEDMYPNGGGGTITQTTVISAEEPINGAYIGAGTDALVPASNAGTAFVYRMVRGTNAFSFISPWCNANVEVRNENNNIVTSGSFTVTQGTSHNLTTTNNATTGIANNSAVMIEVTNGCPILATHHTTTSTDAFVMFPAAQEWYGVGSGRVDFAALQNTTNVTVYKSDGTSAAYVLNRGENVSVNDSGSEGSDPAHRVVADKPIGANSIADSDGSEAATFMPVSEMGYKYYVPQDTQYITIATRENITTTVELYHDGTNCGVGVPDATNTVTPVATYPGKAYFGSTTDGVNIPAGSCVVADEPIFAYYEYATLNDEHNIWTEVQNRQFIYPTPTYSVGAEEYGSWSVDGVNSWIRRVPVTVTNTSTSALTEYQVLVDLGVDVSTMFGKTQTNGGDIRVAGSTGDGTDNIVYSLESFNSGASTGEMWVKVPSIAASSNATFYIYYSPIGVNIAGMSSILWLDAEDTATITESSGSVSAWNDKSGAGNHVSQATPASQPALITDAGNQVVSFNSDFMVDATGIWGNATHNDTYVFGMYKNTNLPENGALLYETLSAQRYGVWSPWGTTTYYQQGGGYLSTVYGGDTTNYHVMRYEAHSSGNRVIARDGTNMITDTGGAAFTGNNSSFQLASYPGGTNPQSVNIGELIIVDGVLTAGQITQIEGYLTQKWISGPTTTLTTTGDHFAVFRTASPAPNYYIVDSLSAASTLSVISFADNNNVNDGTTTQSMDEGEIATLPFASSILQTDVFAVESPLHIAFNTDTTDAALPISYAGTEFVYHVARNLDNFVFYAPFADASVQIQESSGAGWTTLQTVAVTQGTVQNISQDIINARAFKIISDEPILAFHRNETLDAKILYPTHLGLEEDSGNYELYGIGSTSLLLASSTTANVTLYRTDGTSAAVTLNAGNNFTYAEANTGSQGDDMGYHIVSDAPIGASSYADADGSEAVIFVSQKEFSDEYVLSHDTQYMSVVARDASVTCRVYDDTGTEVTSGPATMDNVPAQTTGANSLPHPNRLHIGGNDTTDPAFFYAQYRMECTEPVYAYYEHYVDPALITDENSWLSWPQVRKRNYVEPIVEDPDTVNEEGLYYESGFDSAGAGSDPETYAEYIFDTSATLYGEDTYWRDIAWTEVLNTRSGENSVTQIDIETASATPAPTCAAATYGAFSPLTAVATLSTSNAVLAHTTETTSDKRGLIEMSDSDHSCLKVRITTRTGNTAYAPRINIAIVGYYVPTALQDQLSSPTISVEGATGGAAREYRVMKAVTTDASLAGSESFLTYHGVSAPGVFVQADFDLYEEPTQTAHPQFAFPPFPGTAPVSAIDHTPFDATQAVNVYFTNERSVGGIETIDMSFDTDVLAADGPMISRDFALEVTGI